MDITQIIIAIIGLIGGGTLGTLFRIGVDRREGTLKNKQLELDTIKLQNEELASKTRKIRDLTEEVFSLKDALHETEMKHLCTRCDIQTCRSRKPPLPWMSGAGSDVKSGSLIGKAAVTDK